MGPAPPLRWSNNWYCVAVVCLGWKQPQITGHQPRTSGSGPQLTSRCPRRPEPSTGAPTSVQSRASPRHLLAHHSGSQQQVTLQLLQMATTQE